MLVSGCCQFGSPRSGDLGQGVGVVSRYSSSDKTRRRGHVDDIARLEVTEHRAHTSHQQRFLADRDRVRSTLVDDDLAA